MLENEDSVVTSLNELRKLKHERITRQTQSRAIMGAGRATALAVDPASDQMTPPPALVPQVAPTRQSSQFAQVPAPTPNTSFPPVGASGFQAPAPFSVAPMPPPPVIQVKTSYKAAIVMTVLLAGAAGAGYMKLQTDMQAQLKAKENTIKRIEEERLLAAGVAAKSDAQARSNLRQCEDKLKTAMAAAPAVSAAPAVATASAPVIEKKVEKPAKAARVAKAKPVARPARRAKAEAAEPAAPKAGDVPTIAKKKKLDNDPLAGLGKL